MRLTLLFFFFLFKQLAFAQEQLGLRIERYSGTGSILLNPVNSLQNPLRWDLNIVGIGAFAATNYGFIRQNNIPNILRTAEKATLVTQPPLGGPNGGPILDFYDTNQKKYAEGLTIIHGPALSIRITEDICVGAFYNVRVMGGAHGVTPAVNFQRINQRPYREYFDFPAAKFTGMAWSEIGLNYAQRIELDNGFLGIGATVKYNQGYEGIYVKTIGTISSAQFPNDTFSFVRPTAQFGFTNDNLTIKTPQIQRNGSGLSIDIGAQYIMPDTDSDEYDHRLLVGAALIDLGQINFNKNAEEHFVASNITYQPNGTEFKKVKTYQEALAVMSQKALGNPKKSYVDNHFTIGLPTALSLQFDYKIWTYNYVGASFVQRLPLFKNTLERPNTLSAHYRFEHRWGSFMLPITWHNYKQIHVGAAIRLAYLTIGSDNILGYWGKRDLTNGDFYMALKFNPFKLGLDFGNTSNKKGNGWFSRDKVKCPTF